MKLKSFGFTIMLLAIASIPGFRLKEDPFFVKNLKLKLTEFIKVFPQEKVYLHLDKPFYKPGETIWFNAFVLTSTGHKPTSTSDILYAELVDPKGNVTASRELLIEQGTTHGEFDLGNDATGGLYEVRAYTRWMQNFGDQARFSKKVQVQKVITPRLLFKLDYAKKAYGPSEMVQATLEIRDLRNEPAPDANIKVIINLSGERYQTLEFISNAEGIADIGFPLPDTLVTSDGLLQAIVSYKGLTESISRSIPIVLNRIDLSFYPEGGHILAGAENRIAFKAVNEFGKGADVRGVIVDESDTEVGSFESFHLGMGAFSFKPLADKKYFAVVESPGGKHPGFPIPIALKSGFSLTLTDRTDDYLTWNVHATEKSTAYLIAQSQGTIHYTTALHLDKGDNKIPVPIKHFPSGISVFTLFDQDGRERCERLAFVKSNDQLNISISTDKKKYLPGENVDLTVSTTDDNGNPIPAKLSLSVVDDQLISFADDRQDNLLSYMLLSSEVKGDIEEPSFYFNPREPKAAIALDYLLMTQGWRRFTWKDVVESHPSITHLPEKIKTIYGRLTDAKGQPVVEDVTLVEMGNLKRVLTIRTKDDGSFTFRNTDPTTPIMLLASRKTMIQIEKQLPRPMSAVTIVKEHTSLPEQVIFTEEAEPLTAESKSLAEPETDLDFTLNENVSELSEVVVTGYGTTDKNHLTASVVSVYRHEITSMPSLEYALQGKVAGITVRMPNTSGGSSAIFVRGISSLANNSGDPLFVIDGHPVSPSLNANFSIASIINPHDVESIQVLKSPEADALFGSDAANGAILITTRSRLNWGYSTAKPVQSKYVHTIISPRKFAAVKEFFQDRRTGKHGERTNFNSTVYWHPNIVTNDKGIARVSFKNNDAISTFRITTEGFSANGGLGRAEETYYSQLPFSVDTRLPDYLGFEDILKLPVQVRNETTTALTASITLTLPAELRAAESVVQKINVPPGSVSTFSYTISPTGKQGTFPVSVLVEAANRRDEIKHQIKIKPVGFPVRLSFSGSEKNRRIIFDIRNAEKGTIKGTFSAYPDVLSDLMTGVEAIFRKPYGCFEQTSSSTFPNILALQFMKNSGVHNPEVEAKAMNYIRDGYKRLISFEVAGGGFDWFGKPAAHEALTAYGLIEFIEMKKVYPEVDDKLIARTRDWLLSRRTGNGTFKLYNHGLDDFSRPSSYVSNAYITYALSETGTADLEDEYNHILEVAWGNKDMYQLALAANIAFNLNKTHDYQKLVHYFEKTVDPSRMDNLVASHSVVWSQGQSLTNETVALWTIALMKSGATKLTYIKPCIDYLVSKRSFGMFGSTQSTVLTLKALSEYAKLVKSASHPGEIQLLTNGVKTDSVTYGKDSHGLIELNEFTNSLGNNGKQQMEIQFNNTPDPLPYSVNIEWYTKSPATTPGCKVELTTSLATPSVSLNETVRLSATLKNKSTQGVPMTMAIIGIPAGLSAQPWQLKELQENLAFDFYEIIDGKLCLYFRQMKASEVRTISLDLKAELRGRYTGSASSAYLYYTDELKHWEKGLSITVN